jgi:tRNA threonylcarbamoyladenosine biosynthesis protein TsaE
LCLLMEGDIKLAVYQYKAIEVEQTYRLAEALAKTALPGDILILTGDLGTGKTTLVKGMARILGVDPLSVISPTFTLMQVYNGSIDLIHIDLYRLEKEEEFIGFGGLDYVNEEKALCVIEWGERFLKFIPKDHLHITISFDDVSDARLFTLSSGGNRSTNWLEETVNLLNIKGKQE